MIRRRLLLAAAWVMTLSCITSAQDRGWASSIAWSPDGQTIAVGGGAGVWFFDNDFNEVGYVEYDPDYDPETPRFVEWNSSGDLLAVSTLISNPISIVDVSKFTVITEIDEAYPWTPVRWHPEDDLVIAGTFGGTAYIWNARTGDEQFSFDGRTEAYSEVIWHESMGFCWFSENTVVIVNKQMAYVVDIIENTVLRKFVVFLLGDWLNCNRDYQIISLTGRQFDFQSGTSARLFPRYDFGQESTSHAKSYSTEAVAWSPESGHIVTSLEGCRTRVFDGQSRELLVELPGGVYELMPAVGFFIDSIAWHPDGSRFAVVGQFGDIRVWDAKTYELLQRFDGFEMHPATSANLKKFGKISDWKCP